MSTWVHNCLECLIDDVCWFTLLVELLYLIFVVEILVNIVVIGLSLMRSLPSAPLHRLLYGTVQIIHYYNYYHHYYYYYCHCRCRHIIREVVISSLDPVAEILAFVVLRLTLPVTSVIFLLQYYYFFTRGKPLVAQKLQKKTTKLVWKWTLLWPVVINETIMQQNRIETLHHNGNPLE